VYTFLREARGFSMSAAGTSVSLFWGGLMLSRVVFGLLPSIRRPARLMRVCIGSVALAAGVLILGSGVWLSLGAVAVLGFACGPIFPSLIAATPARLGSAHAANGVGFQVAAAACGQALIPWAVGGVAQQSSLAILGPLLLGFAIALMAVHEALVRFGSVRAAEAT
jgi:fucose permease